MVRGALMSVRARPSAHNDGQRHRGPGGGLEGVGGEAGAGPPVSRLGRLGGRGAGGPQSREGVSFVYAFWLTGSERRGLNYQYALSGACTTSLLDYNSTQYCTAAPPPAPYGVPLAPPNPAAPPPPYGGGVPYSGGGVMALPPISVYLLFYGQRPTATVNATLTNLVSNLAYSPYWGITGEYYQQAPTATPAGRHLLISPSSSSTSSSDSAPKVTAFVSQNVTLAGSLYISAPLNATINPPTLVQSLISTHVVNASRTAVYAVVTSPDVSVPLFCTAACSRVSLRQLLHGRRVAPGDKVAVGGRRQVSVRGVLQPVRPDERDRAQRRRVRRFHGIDVFPRVGRDRD